MTNNSDIVFTPAARRAQAARGSAKLTTRRPSRLSRPVTPELAAFIAEQDTAFLGTASADGAPYIQHRGGPKGFIKVVDERTLGFADYRGNRQYITLGNLSENDRAYLFLLDFSRRQRIKLWGRARVVENDDALIEQLFDPRLQGPARAGDPVHHRGLGRELLAAHHRAIHPAGDGGCGGRVAPPHCRAGGGERTAPRRAWNERRAIKLSIATIPALNRSMIAG